MDQVEYPKIVQSMLNPHFYVENPIHVEMIQTQMSFIFLTKKHAYKIKKPVNLGYLDYRTLDKRQHYCELELILNRRLCPDVYLAVLPICTNHGNIEFGNQGEIIDYAVMMKRLPSEKMLNILLQNNQVTDEMIIQVAHKIALFHQQAATGDEINNYGEISTITDNCRENFDQTEKSVGRTIAANKYKRLKEYTSEFISQNTDLFNQRINNKKIRDCHGDLHAAHICFTDGICIYDCIEFNDRFRYGDIASEAAFLAMDLDRHGRADLSYLFLDNYIKDSSDQDILKILPFYKMYRAYVRGKVESFKIDDPYMPQQEKQKAALFARGYFNLAGFYIRPFPTLIVMIGVTGSGKSYFAARLAQQIGAVIFSSDAIRKQIANVPLDEHHFDLFDTGLYSSENTEKTYNELITRAEKALLKKQSVILDASFVKRKFRQEVFQLAKMIRADILFIECRAPNDEIIHRLNTRMKTGSVSDGREEILIAQNNHFEPVDEIADKYHLIIDTSLDIESNIQLVLKKLGEE